MAFVEMGPVSNSLVRYITKRFKPQTAAPLFTRETPRRAASQAAEKKPITVAPLNRAEAKEQDTLRSLRDALLSD